MLLPLLLNNLMQAQPQPPEPLPDLDQFRPPVLGRGPGTTVAASEMRRQAHKHRRRARRLREDMLFL